MAIVEPFYSGSHKNWVDDLIQHLPFDVHSFTLPGRHWKWRMAAGAIELANKVNQSILDFDVFLVTDMLDVSTFKSLLHPKFNTKPIVLYMHENQVVYPFQTNETDKTWDRHYGLINYKSILCANQVWFNSNFHKQIFTTELERFLAVMPEPSFHKNQVLKSVEKFSVMPLGLNFSELEKCKTKKNDKPTILWNHRWEHDKNPELFFRTLIKLSGEGLDFDLIVAGEQYSRIPEIFAEAKQVLEKHIIHWGYFENKSAYYKALWSANILPVTANQEFFGLSVMEAVYCGVTPILPNRLSYSDIYHSLDVFYKSDDIFYDRLKEVIANKSYVDFQDAVTQYDWKRVSGLYAEALLKAVV